MEAPEAPAPPVDALPPAAKLRPAADNQITHHADPVSLDTPTETPHDLFCLAKEYERRGRLPDAAGLYLKASMNGHLAAMVSYASHLVATDERAAFVWLRAAAERGDPRAWAELGQLLARGRYFEVNAIDAARCWKRAAQMGDNTGKSALGLCYIRGFGVRQDPERGVEIVRQVADVHNDITAMRNLAWIYRHGKGVPKNPAEADYWDARAKKQERLMARISTREQALFGRGRLSRHSRHRPSRDSEGTTPPADAPAREGDLRDAPAEDAPPPRDPVAAGTDAPEQPRPRPSPKTVVLEEQDLENRLRGVRDDPARRSPDPLAAEEQAPELQEHRPRSRDGAAASAASAAAVSGAGAVAGVAFEPEVAPAEQAQFPRGQPMETGLAGQTPAASTLPGTTGDSKDTLLHSSEGEKGRQRTVEASAAAAGAAAAAVGAATATAFGRGRAAETDGQPAGVGTGRLTQGSAVERRGLEELVAASEKLQQPHFVPTASLLETTSAEESRPPPIVADFDLLPSEIRAVQQTATKAVEDINSNTPPVVADIHAQRAEKVAGRAAEPPEDAQDEQQFITPEQSLEGDDEISPGLPRPTAVAARAGATAGLARAARPSAVDEEGSDYLAGDEAFVESAAVAASAGTRASRVESPETSPLPEGGGPLSPTKSRGVDNSHAIGPAVRSRARLFERSGNAEDDDHSDSPQPEMQKTNSYSLHSTEGAVAADHGPDDLDEFERADMQRMTTETPGSRPTYTAETMITCKVTRATTASRLRQSPTQRAYDKMNDGGYGDDPPNHDNLRDLLALYPKNPLRADSQVPLFHLVNTIQRFPISDLEAYNILEQGNGLAKIIVAMLCQHEDEFLQEQGLHSFVRVVRAAPSAQRENLVLLSYADCYRTAMGDMDAVVPKGSIAIDERSSGAIQAIVQAMRHHPSVRRVQLAGCASLGEVAAVSPSCRSLAYDHGAVNLIVAGLRHRSSQAACTIHDIASRALSNFCSGKENFAFKEAFAGAGAVAELISILQLWGHAEDVKSELLTTATKNCCLALRHISDSCNMASSQCVQSFAYHHLIRVMVLRRNDVSVCTIVVSAMAAITRNGGLVAERGLQDAKPLPEVLITMQAHSEHPLFIRKCLDFMEALGNFNSMKEEIVLAGGIPFAADIIQRGGNDSLLLERACSVVEKLCRSNPKNQENFASNNGILSLTALLGTHQSLPGVVERALLAFTSATANNSKTQKEAVKVGAPDQVMRSLGTYSAKNSKVVAASTSAMAAMVVPRNSAVAQSYAKLKAPELVVRAMKRHPDSVMVQENGSAAIASFCEADPRIISMLLKSGISGILVVALQRFLHKQTAVVQIVRAMRALSNEASEDSYRFKSKLLTDRSNESTLSEIFHTALAYHKKGLPDTATVIISICATINRLCMRSVAFKNEVGKDGIVEELNKLVEKTAEYKDLGALQPVLATICTLVLDSEDNKNRFHAVGGVEAILDVMQKWKSDTYVLEHCCAALRYSCNEHFGNCDEVKNHNGVRSILSVMELHPENVNVLLWCCLTLADLCKGDEELQSSPNVVQGIRKVVSAMYTFSGNSRFLASACEFLRAASVDNAENQERIVRLGGRTAIVKAMEGHPQDQTLTESGAYALLLVQEVQDARTSVDSHPQLGLVKRLSRELRRSGSSSNRNSGKGGLLGRKSRSFSGRRKSATAEGGEGEGESQVQPAKEATRPRRSLINFSRGGRSRSEKAKPQVSAPVQEADEESLDEPEDEPQDGPQEESQEINEEGAQDGYGEVDPPPGPEAEADTVQMD